MTEQEATAQALAKQSAQHVKMILALAARYKADGKGVQATAAKRAALIIRRKD